MSDAELDPNYEWVEMTRACDRKPTYMRGRKRTDLLSLLASMPPEQLTEGAQIAVETVGGDYYTVTIGKRVEIEDDEPLAAYTIPLKTTG